MNVFYTNTSQLPQNGYSLLMRGATLERRNKAKRYTQQEDAIRCLVGGAMIQHIAGWDYEEDYTPEGKPFICGREEIHFNLSHSGKYVALAFGDTEVGVDVEEIPQDPDRLKIARRYFTQDEQEYVFSAPEDALVRFTEIWTKKESFLKFLGIGLRKDLTSFSVLSPEYAPHFHTQVLEGGYVLTVCTTEDHVRFEKISVKWFLPRS